MKFFFMTALDACLPATSNFFRKTLNSFLQISGYCVLTFTFSYLSKLTPVSPAWSYNSSPYRSDWFRSMPASFEGQSASLRTPSNFSHTVYLQRISLTVNPMYWISFLSTSLHGDSGPSVLPAGHRAICENAYFRNGVTFKSSKSP